MFKKIPGCFENYLGSRAVDVISQSGSGAGRTKMEQIVDWLVFHDVVDTRVSKEHLFELAKYQPYTIINFHRLFAGISKIQVTFPKADYEVMFKI